MVVADVVVRDRIVREDGVVEEVVEDLGITNLNHEDYGVIPPFAIPNPNK